MTDWTIPDGTTVVDARSGQAYDGIAPGDTIILPSTRTSYITFWGLQGANNNVITITNSGGQTSLDGTVADASMKLRDCEYVKVTGTGDSSTTYGFKFSNGVRGMWLGWGCSDIEVEYVHIFEIDDGAFGNGIYCVTTEGQDSHYRASFTMDNMRFHHIWIDTVLTSGFYVGGTANTDPKFDGLHIYDCTIESSGTEAIQVRVGDNAYIHHNVIRDANTGLVAGNLTAIMCGPDGTNYNVYNNLVDDVNDHGIYNHLDSGEGPMRVYNNIIQNSGADTGSIMIWCDYDAPMNVYNNTIVSNAGYGIYFTTGGTGHTCFDNISVGNGNTDIVNSNTSFAISNNVTGAVADVLFMDSANDDYHLTSSSPAVDAGSDSGYAPFDYDDNARPQGIASDIGAYEYTTAGEGVSNEMTEYKMRFLNTTGTLVAEITDYRELSYHKQVNDPGRAAFVVDGDHAVIDLIANNYQVEVWRRMPRYDVDWYRDFSGLLRGQTRWTTGSGIGYYRGEVLGDMTMLGWRIVAYPAGTKDRSEFTSEAAETVMKTLVEYNATGTATTANGRDRAGSISGITVEADVAAGNSIDWFCARKNLLTELQQIARVGGGDFDLYKTGTASTWDFRWYTGQRGSDLSSTVIFSLERGNMNGPRYTYDRTRERTVAIAAGQGQGEARTVEVRTGDDYNVTSNNIEMLVDAKRFSTTAGIQDEGDRKLDETKARQELTFDIMQTPASLYGKHYCINGVLGDLVTARYNSISMTQKIVAVTVGLIKTGGERVDVQMETQ